MAEKPTKKLYMPKNKKLFATTKEYIFDFLKQNPEITMGKQLLEIFPDIPSATLYAYLTEFIKNEDSEIKYYVPHIFRVLHCLAYKYVIQKHTSIEEEKSIRECANLVEKYKHLTEGIYDK